MEFEHFFIISCLLWAFVLLMSAAPRGTLGRWLTGRKNRSGLSISRFVEIREKHKSFAEVEESLRKSGIEGCELIVGVDFFAAGRNVHARSVSGEPNPHKTVLRAIAQSLAPLNVGGDISPYGFGDSTTRDLDVFSFNADEAPCRGPEVLLARYEELAASGQMEPSSPRSFAPLIRRAVDMVASTGNRFHVLLIVTAGEIGATEELETAAALLEASKYPLSVICVGVGDGPFGQLRTMGDRTPRRAMDNFEFLEFRGIRQMAERIPTFGSLPSAGGASLGAGQRLASHGGEPKGGLQRGFSATGEAFLAALAMCALNEVPRHMQGMAKSGLFSRAGATASGGSAARRRRPPLPPPDGGGLAGLANSGLA